MIFHCIIYTSLASPSLWSRQALQEISEDNPGGEKSIKISLWILLEERRGIPVDILGMTVILIPVD